VSARFFAFAHDAPALAVGACDLNNIVRGAFQACYLGYSMDGASQGRGLGAEAVAAVVDCGFQTLGLHRIMANYQPDNERSARLLASLGFVVEGRAQEYLLLGGRWSDHVLTAKTAPDWLDQWEPQK
jgi:ribosomal-protein-alanine N-acetyltransferase